MYTKGLTEHSIKYGTPFDTFKTCIFQIYKLMRLLMCYDGQQTTAFF